MKNLTTLCLLSLFAAPAFASDPFVADMRRIMDSFDTAGAAAMPRVRPPAHAASRLGAPVDTERWAPVTEVKGFAARPAETVDALSSLEVCAVADAVYIRQPSLEEAARALTPCLEAVSKRYGAAAVVSTERGSLVIRIPSAAAEAPLARDLEKSLASRQSRLYGHPVILRADLASFAPRGTSVLQPVLERCAGAKMLPADAEAFVAVYGDCLTGAKGLGISAVSAHPSEARTVVVYSAVRADSLRDMTGTVNVPSVPGAAAFRIEARRQLPFTSASR